VKFADLASIGADYFIKIDCHVEHVTADVFRIIERRTCRYVAGCLGHDMCKEQESTLVDQL
jgi:hypothetical protein